MDGRAIHLNRHAKVDLHEEFRRSFNFLHFGSVTVVVTCSNRILSIVLMSGGDGLALPTSEWQRALDRESHPHRVASTRCKSEMCHLDSLNTLKSVAETAATAVAVETALFEAATQETAAAEEETAGTLQSQHCAPSTCKGC